MNVADHNNDTPGGVGAAVFVVDDDTSVRRSLARLLSSLDFKVTTCASGEEFLHRLTPDMEGCVITDLKMGGISGLELQEMIRARNNFLRIVFISAHGDMSSAIRAMKGGAVDFLRKPVDSRALFEAVCRAINASSTAKRQHLDLVETRARLAQLSPQELEVLGHLVGGKQHGQIAGDLGMVEQAVTKHRIQIMEKLAVSSITELIRLVERAQPPSS